MLIIFHIFFTCLLLLDGNCPKGQFVCPDGSCIDAKWKCDGVEDCSGGDDERFCGNGKM